MMKLKIFGLLEHLGFYLIFVSLALFLVFGGYALIYLAIVSWLLSLFSHTAESLLENRSLRKIVIGV